jgi:2-oxoglutarate dehydrogenase E1 component
LREETPEVAIVRIEQLAPFQNTAIRTVLANYPNAQELIWLQEEPRNMGAWSFVAERLRNLAASEPAYVGRPERASPAEGFAADHEIEQNRIIRDAFMMSPERPHARGRRKSHQGSTD